MLKIGEKKRKQNSEFGQFAIIEKHFKITLLLQLEKINNSLEKYMIQTA